MAMHMSRNKISVCSPCHAVPTLGAHVLWYDVHMNARIAQATCGSGGSIEAASFGSRHMLRITISGFKFVSAAGGSLSGL